MKNIFYHQSLFFRVDYELKKIQGFVKGKMKFQGLFKVSIHPVTPTDNTILKHLKEMKKCWIYRTLKKKWGEPSCEVTANLVASGLTPFLFQWAFHFCSIVYIQHLFNFFKIFQEHVNIHGGKFCQAYLIYFKHFQRRLFSIYIKLSFLRTNHIIFHAIIRLIRWQNYCWN